MHGFPEEVSYGAAKAAQVNLTLSAARELARFGVTANVVHPPITDTGWINQTASIAQSAGRRVASRGRSQRSSPIWPRTRPRSSPATSSGCADAA